MDFIALLANIEASGETILANRVKEVITDAHRYVKVNGEWSLDTEPGSVKQVYNRNGVDYVWQREME